MRNWIAKNRSKTLMVFCSGALLTNISSFLFGVIDGRLVIAADVFVANIVVFGSMFLMGWWNRRKNKSVKVKI